MYTYLAILCVSTLLLMLQQHKQNKGINYLLLGIEVIMLVFSKNNSDYSTYLKIYDGELNLPYEIGMKTVGNILRCFGLEDYTYFLILVMILVLFVFYKWGKIIPYINHVLYFYTLFIMYYDCIQIRNTIATFMLLYALYLALYDKKITAILICFLATFFHRLTFLTGLILAYIVFSRRHKTTYEVSKKEIGLNLLLGFSGAILGRPLIKFLAPYNTMFAKAQEYLAIDSGYDSLIIWAGSTAVILVLLWYTGVKKALDPLNTNVPEIRKKAVNYLYRYALFSIGCSGLLLFLEEFNRVYRLFNLMLFMVFGMIESEMTWKSRRLVFIIIVAINVIFMLVALPRGVDLDTFFIKR